jgi:hypothetical protein
MCNAAVDQAPTDAEIQAKVRAMMKRMEHAVAVALGESAAAGDWDVKRRGRAALALINAYLGLRVLARSGASAQELAAVIDTTMRGYGLAENRP